MRYVRYALPALFFVPVVTLYRRGSVPVDIGVAIFWCAIPLIGLLTRSVWFFYYVYVIVPLTLALAVAALWSLSLFGDQAYSLAAIAGLLWPIFVYGAAVLVLTAFLQKNRGRRER